MSENGGDSTTLMLSRQQRVESGLTAFQEMQAEVSGLRGERDGLAVKLASLQAEHDALQLAYARMLTEMDGKTAERDRAVDRHTEVETLLIGLYAQMQRFMGPPKPQPGTSDE